MLINRSNLCENTYLIHRNAETADSSSLVINGGAGITHVTFPFLKDEIGSNMSPRGDNTNNYNNNGTNSSQIND